MNYGKYARAAALALSFPSSVFGIFWFFNFLSEKGFINKTLSMLLSLLITIYLLSMIVYYAIKKNKN